MLNLCSYVCVRLWRLSAQVNSEDFAGWLALHVACYYGAAKVADMMLRRGAQVGPAEQQQQMQTGEGQPLTHHTSTGSCVFAPCCSREDQWRCTAQAATIYTRALLLQQVPGLWVYRSCARAHTHKRNMSHACFFWGGGGGEN